MTAIDYIAIGVFVLCWLGLEPVMAGIWPGKKGIAVEIKAVRRGWMKEVLTRDLNFIGDVAIIGQIINSSSFFGSANLVIIVGLSGALFLQTPINIPSGILGATDVATPAWFLHIKILLVLATLLRSLFDFIWAVRQLNYTLAAIGSSPSRAEERDVEAWADALTMVLNPSLRTFSAGVRGYYFTIAGSFWIFGSPALIVATLFASGLLYWRQTYSDTAKGVTAVRLLLENARANQTGRLVSAEVVGEGIEGLEARSDMTLERDGQGGVEHVWQVKRD